MSKAVEPARAATRWRLVATEEYRDLVAAGRRNPGSIADLQARLSAAYDRLVAAQLELSRIQMDLAAIRRG